MKLQLPITALLATSLVLAQEGRNHLDAPQVVLPEDSPPFQKLFDCDGDGDLDAVGARMYSDGSKYEIRVWRNDNGAFVPRDFFADSMAVGIGRSMAVATGDFDKDGKQDFAVAGGQSVWIFTNTGTGFSGKTVGSAGGLGGLVAADVDGDKALDLAWNDTAASRLVVRLATGAIYYVSATGSRVESVEIDGDVEAELGVWSPTGHQLECYRFDKPVLTKGITFTATIAPAIWAYWTSGDIDGDGDQDVLAFELPTQTTQARVHAFRRTGALTFAAVTPYAGGPAEFLADIDGDGSLDGVCCGGGGPTHQWPTLAFGSYFQISLNDGRGTFAPGFGFPGKGSVQMAGVADVDRDGDMDLVAGACVFFARRKFHAATTPVTGMDVFFPDSRNYLRALQDVDRDGDLDFVPATGNVFLNQADGTFVATTSDVSAATPNGYTMGQPRFVGDFDGDGSPDFVAPLLGSASAFSHMGLFRNNGSGRWGYAGAAAAAQVRIGWTVNYGDPRRGAYSEDLDDDGDLDLVATADPAYDTNARTEVYWNDGQGRFTPGPTFAGVVFLAAADFDGDQRTDLLMTTGYPGVVQFRLGTGSASTPFGAPAILAGPRPALTLDPARIVDVNDDGKPDFSIKAITGSNARDREVQFWCNTSTGAGQVSFAKAALQAGPLYSDLGDGFAADFDADGMTDVAILHPRTGGGEVVIHRRKSGTGAVLGAGDFEPGVAQVMRDGWPVDADRDGDIDFAGSHVLRNTRFHGTPAGSVRQYGAGCAGEAGAVPVFGAVGPFRVGATMDLRLSGVTGPAPAILVLGLRPAEMQHFPAPSVTFLVDPSLLIVVPWPVTAASRGIAAAAMTLRVPLPASALGAEAYEQVLVLDPAASGGLSASNGLHMKIGT